MLRRLGAWAMIAAFSALSLPGQDDAGFLKRLSVEDLMQMQVTSVSRYPEKLLNAASAVQVISSTEIRRSGFSTIPDSLRLADNLNVAQKNPHDWAISARGFNANVGNKLLVLMDGRSVYTPLFSGVFWNSQDYVLEDIERIEVISGPGGTLWGANAVNGVINITTKSARDTLGTLVEAGGGTELRYFGSVRHGVRIGANSYLRVYGKYANYDHSVLRDGTDADNEWEQSQAGFRFDAHPSADDTITLQGDVYTGDLALQGQGTARIAGGNVLTHWFRRFANDTELSTKLYFDRTHLRDPFGASPFQPAGLLIDQLDTIDLEVQHRFWLGTKHRIVWGGGIRQVEDRVEQQAPNFGFFPAEKTLRTHGLFVQDEIKVANDVYATLGSKIEHNTYTGWELEPNVRLRWDVSSNHMVWAAVSRAVRTPSRFDRELAIPSIPPVLIQGSGNFESEIVVSQELGYRAQINAQLTGSVSLFYNDYDELRGLAPTPVTFLPLSYSNILEAETYGAELTLQYQPFKWWTIKGGYAYLHADVREKTGKVDFGDALGETQDPENQFSVRSFMELPNNFELGALFRWVDVLPTADSGTRGSVPAYAELNLRVAWHPTQTLELSIVGQNLLKSQHPEYGHPSAAREELQRGVYGKAVWRF